MVICNLNADKSPHSHQVLGDALDFTWTLLISSPSSFFILCHTQALLHWISQMSSHSMTDPVSCWFWFLNVLPLHTLVGSFRCLRDLLSVVRETFADYLKIALVHHLNSIFFFCLVFIPCVFS